MILALRKVVEGEIRFCVLELSSVSFWQPTNQLILIDFGSHSKSIH